MVEYRERINPLNSCQQEQPTSSEIDSHRVPAEAAPVCEQSILISRLTGERAFVDMAGGVEGLTSDYVSIVIVRQKDQPRPAKTHQTWILGSGRMGSLVGPRG